MTEDLFSVARKAKEEVERGIVSKLGLGSIFEGIGNIINIIGKVTEEGDAPEAPRSDRGTKTDEKTPVCSYNSQ